MTEKTKIVLVANRGRRMRKVGGFTLIVPEGFIWGDALHMNVFGHSVTAVYCAYKGERALDVTYWSVKEVFAYRDKEVELPIRV